MDENFQQVIDALGNYSVGMLPGVREIAIYADDVDRTAHMVISLRYDTWEDRANVITELAQIRQNFIDDVSLSYSFGAAFEAQVSEDAEHTSKRIFADA